ncbi:MAG: SAM-dependent methyltransferase [Nanoarchaeota archaeon]|nr:SAM-dependent methyltransferase [Nanoarchaeota archaeon]
MKYVIEHLEPELFEWCLVEYKHISKIVGKNKLIITNLKEEDLDKLEDYADCRVQSVKDINFNNTCVLDPFASKELNSDDKFEYLIFGGILGDNPPRRRTEEELQLPGERRSLGKEQMATDNAVYVAKQLVDGKKMQDLKFQEGIEILLADGESVIFDFKYILVDGKPLISDALVKHLKEREEF